MFECGFLVVVCVRLRLFVSLCLVAFRVLFYFESSTYLLVEKLNKKLHTVFRALKVNRYINDELRKCSVPSLLQPMLTIKI